MYLYIFVQRSDAGCLNVSLPHLCSVSLQSPAGLSPLLLSLLLTVSTFPSWDRGEISEVKASALFTQELLGDVTTAATALRYFFCLFASSRELKYGIPVTDENGNRLGESPNAAKQAIMQVVVSRIGMAVPAMGNVNIISAGLLKWLWSIFLL